MSVFSDRLPFAKAVQAVLAEAGVTVDPSDWELHAGGSAHIVVNAGHSVSVRIAKNTMSGENVFRRAEALRKLPDFDFSVPRPVTPVMAVGRYTAVGLTWIPGHPRKPGPVNPQVLADVLEQLKSADPAAAASYLDKPGQHWGGLRRRHVLIDEVVPRLLPRNRDRALAAIEDLVALDTVEPRLIHGDLMGTNMLWDEDKLVGIIDWDHACLSDPAYDAASLGLWFGWDTVADAVDPVTLERAKLHAQIFPLQTVAYAIHHELDTAQINQAVEKADTWFERHSSTHPIRRGNLLQRRIRTRATVGARIACR